MAENPAESATGGVIATSVPPVGELRIPAEWIRLPGEQWAISGSGPRGRCADCGHSDAAHSLTAPYPCHFWTVGGARCDCAAWGYV